MATKIKSARDALEKIRDYILTGKAGDGCMAPIINWCDAALAEPPRNCDVGTVKEQAKRMEDFCNQYETCGLCRLHKSQLQCELEWTQMPYEADKKGEEDGN